MVANQGYDHRKKPPFCIFENVDRLLKSPAKQRGRDFGVILACLAQEGYSVEWRVVNAAQYGAAQRRRRTFIFAYRNDTIYGQKMGDVSVDMIIKDDGLMAKAFPTQNMGRITETAIGGDIVDVSDNFAFVFENAGYMRKSRIYTAKVIEQEEEPITLRKSCRRMLMTDSISLTKKCPNGHILKVQRKSQGNQQTVMSIHFQKAPLRFLTRGIDLVVQC